MKKLGQFIFLSYFCFSFLITPAISGEEGIPLSDIRLPSNDLVFPNGRILTAEEAWELKKNEGLDLSLLNPKASELWNDKKQIQGDDLSLEEKTLFRFLGALTSQSGLFRFNAESLAGGDSGPFIIHLDKTLHSTLLRKNLLRKLGYKIPAMQYLKSLTLRFDSLAQKENFLKRQLPENTFGAPRRWVSAGLEGDELEITLQDVAISRPSETDHYNLALGVPPTTQLSRTLRALIIPYALTEIGESINKTTWSVGRVENNEIRLRHFSLANLNATMDDALWILKRLESLSSADIKEVVQNAFFPKEVEILLIEKMLSRRNSLFKLFKLKTKDFKVNQKPESGSLLVKGALTQEEWSGHAARYSHGTPDSPFQDIGYFAFAEIQSSVIENLISRANEHLSVFDINEARMEHLTNEFTEGLNHFVETGEFLEQGVSTWFTPTLDGQLILSRDIIIGNHLGTNNLVQLADTIGYSVRLGGHLGIEGLEFFTSASVNAGLSYSKIFSHLKPVRTLKESVKEPYKNMLVPLLKRSLRSNVQSLADYIAQNPDATDEQRDQALSDILSDLNSSLGVGESIIVTERISPNLGATGRLVILDGGVSSVGIDVSGLLIKRLHFLRKDSSTLQVYVDNGLSGTMTLSFSFDHTIPILRFQDKRTKGKYDLQIYDIDLNIKKDENPKLQEQAAALTHLLKTNSTELLDEVSPASAVKNNFVDSVQRLSLLHWRSRSIRQNDQFVIKTPESPESHYVKVSTGLQSGLNYRAFLTDIANYYIGKYTANIRLSTDSWKNPGQTFFGTSETGSGRFEARLFDTNEIDHLFVSLTERKEGWSISEKRLRSEIDNINQRYGRVLFPETSAREATNLKIFTISTQLNIYQEGLERLLFESNDALKTMQRSYRSRSAFDLRCNPHRNRLMARNSIECGNFATVFTKVSDCRKSFQNKEHHKLGRCLVELSQNLVNHLDFDDVVALIGHSNLYLNGQINGFRKDSEILIDPIRSNTFGQISSRFHNGPVDAVRTLLGVEPGEFNGYWMRETF